MHLYESVWQNRVLPKCAWEGHPGEDMMAMLQNTFDRDGVSIQEGKSLVSVAAVIPRQDTLGS